MKTIQIISASVMIFGGMIAGMSILTLETDFFKVGLVVFIIGYAIGKIKLKAL